MTVWSDRHEIFLEHRAIVAGSGVTFVTHVTDLESLEPRLDGPVTFAMVSGPETKLVEVPAPARPGIYTPAIDFPRAGTWRVSLRIPDGASVHEVDLGDFEAHATREDALASTFPEAPEGIPFLKEQQWKVLLGTSPAGRARVVDRAVLPGIVKARPEGHARVSPPLAGILLPPAGRPFPSLGDRVEAGQVLARVQPATLEILAKIAEAGADAARAEVTLERSEMLLARTAKLAAESARSARDVEDAEFSVRTARIERDAALSVREAYRGLGAVLDGVPAGEGGLPALEVRAPISGLVTVVAAAPGEQVSPDRPVAEILDPARVHIDARVPEVDVGKLAQGLAASLETPDAPGRLDPILPGSGRVVLLGLTVDPPTRTVPIVYEVDNPQGRLRIGMAVTVHVETQRVETALVVPGSAIVDEDVRFVAFVQVAGETFEKREVTLGIRDGDLVQVLGGLAEGDRVVTRGAYAVRLASVSTSIPAHGHAH